MPPTDRPAAGHARTRTAPAHATPTPRQRPDRPASRRFPPSRCPRPRRGTTGVFERLRALPESRFVDRVLRGRAWIWVIGIMLGGIVAMQVSLLKLNSGISHSVEQAGTLERVNADLETEVARLSSGERIQARRRRGGDGRAAGRRRRATSELAPADRPAAWPPSACSRPATTRAQLMANGGRAPAALAPAPIAPVVPETTATTAGGR